jgi:DNA-binding winged helix-turn-helix (wHTH) protein/tetratricopeptide (TPR) repeat protein
MARESTGRDDDVRLFRGFRLDVRDERLWRGTEELKLRRKPFSILQYLTAHPLRLVTQDELVEAVWGKIAMSESLLRTHVSELRRILGEDAIETVVGRGYRFLLEVEAAKPASTGPAPVAAAPLVGRSGEMGVLRQVFDTVLDQRRQLVFVTGEPGIGKTTLVDAFLAQVVRPYGALVVSGSCVEQFGPGEAYLPVLAALGAACRGPDGARIVDRVGRYAPTWLAQMPGLVDDEKLHGLLLRVQGASQTRMLRELAEAFDVLAADRPFVLVLEDVHCADRSTIDLLAMLGARRETGRILVLVTCRPAELTKGDGVARLIAELGARRQALTVHLETWSEAALADYLGRRFLAARLPRELAGTLHQMTGGNPLFAVGVVDDLESRRMIQLVEGVWQMEASLAEVASRRPDTIRQLIDIQIDRLKSTEQRILEAASLAGSQFAVGVVAHALELPADEVETCCEGLAGEGRFLRFVSTEDWPDGTIQSHYAFGHALYRDAALRRIPGRTRRLWHHRVAVGLEAAYGDSSESIAAELAIHFEEAQIIGKAVHYSCAAGERAMRRFGRTDALAHFERARALLGKLAPSEESDRTELLALKHVGSAMIALEGFHDPLLEPTFTRAADLARKMGDCRSLFEALLGLQRCHLLRGELREVERLEGEVAAIVPRLADPVAAAEATVLSSSARLFRGQLAAARAPLTEACKVLDAAQIDVSRVAHAPAVGLSGGHLTVLAWLRGAADEAIALADKMLERAESLRDPFHLSTAHTIAALAHMWRREPDKTFEFARQALQAARDVGTVVWQGRATSLYYWAATTLEPQKAPAHAEALSSHLSGTLGGAPFGRTAFTPCVVEVLHRAGLTKRALRELDDALAFVEATDERAWCSELHRLRGELLGGVDAGEARREFTTAIDVAREQGARSFELRAALSLAKLAGTADRKALEELRRVYGSFAEGFATGDLAEAKALLGRAKRHS